MKIIDTKFKGLKIITQDKFKDNRGYLRITHNQKLLKKKKFVFEYCTSTKAKILRGFHFQTKFKQAKYVNVLKGKILDCVIDLRKNSKTFGKSFKIILSSIETERLFIDKNIILRFLLMRLKLIFELQQQTPLEDFAIPAYKTHLQLKKQRPHEKYLFDDSNKVDLH